MSAAEVLLRLASTIPAALSAWIAVALYTDVLRLRHPAVARLLAAVAVATTCLAAFGASGVGFVWIDGGVRTDAAWASYAPALLSVWAGVATLLAVRRIRRLGAAAAHVDVLAVLFPPPPGMARRIAELAGDAGVGAPRVAAPDGEDPPFVAGLRRPVLVVPRGFWESLGDEDRRAAVLHELGHIRRRDPLRAALAGFLQDALWPNLPFRALLRRWRATWETAADGLALRLGARADALARTVAGASAGPRRLQGALGLGCDAHADTVARLRLLLRSPSRRALLVQAAILAATLPCPFSRGHGVRIDPVPPGADSQPVWVGAGWGPGTLFSLLVRAGLDRLPPD